MCTPLGLFSNPYLTAKHARLEYCIVYSVYCILYICTMVAKGHVNPLNCQLQKLSLNSGHTLLMMMIVMKMMMMVIFDLENSNTDDDGCDV